MSEEQTDDEVADILFQIDHGAQIDNEKIYSVLMKAKKTKRFFGDTKKVT